MSTALRPDISLRRRMHILERAHSDFSTHSKERMNAQTEQAYEESADDEFGEDEGPSMEYETPSDSSETGSAPPSPITFASSAGAEAGSFYSARGSPSPPPSNPPEIPTQTRTPHAPQRAWYQLDLAVVAALVSPVGNLLTGGDIIKNVLYICLLVWYLHQVVEAPWNIYQKSRRRTPSPVHPVHPLTPIESLCKERAETELQRIEMLFLAMSALSPFLGASLLRYTLTTMAGKDVLTWFSTGVFVLATGIRPWTHIIERIGDRVDALHDVIHYPPSSASAPDTGKEQLKKDMTALERRVMDEVFEYVDEAVDVVEGELKRHEKRCEKWEGRVRDTEVGLEGLRTRVKRLSMPPPVDTGGGVWTWLRGGREAPRRSGRFPPTVSPRYSVHSFSSGSSLDIIPEEGAPRAVSPPSIVDRAEKLPLVGRAVSLVVMPYRTTTYVYSLMKVW